MASAAEAPLSAPSLSEAYLHCARTARTHYENFTVVSWLLPRKLRPHFHAVYAFCRSTDDLGDEAAGDRLTLLDEWARELDRCYTGSPSHPVMVALQDTVRRFDIPDAPFRKLIEANRMDQRLHRHPTYHDLLHYCEHSANPVGHMVLYLLGHRDEERQRLSDATCTALQLANFWQDVRRDWEMGRIYLPLEDLDRFGYSEADLERGLVNGPFRALIRFEVDRAEALFHQGLPLVERLRGRARLDVALFSKGGLAVLKAIRRQDYDVLSHRPTVTSSRKVWLIFSTALRMAVLGRP